MKSIVNKYVSDILVTEVKINRNYMESGESFVAYASTQFSWRFGLNWN